MEFTKIKIKNFFNLKNVELVLNTGNTLIVGPNGSGKTNITKCVQFLVNGVLEKYLGKPAAQCEGTQEIWKPYKECFVEIQARFIKGGLELFSRLRAVCLMGELCKFVCIVLGLLGKWYPKYKIRKKKKAYRESRFFPEDPPDSSDSSLSPVKVNVEREEALFKSLPSKIRRIASRMADKSEFQALMNSKSLCKVIVDFVKRVFPKLIKITESHLPEGATDRSEDRHVRMTAHTQDSGKLDFSIDM